MTMSPTTDTPPPPAPVYAAAAPTYWAAGWRGILPLPARRKKPVPEGWTGNTPTWPSYPDIQAWADDRPDANLALRLPDTVIGIDVDAYPGKPGAATLANSEATWGTLPHTWRTTSRDDGVSGIRLYRVPAGLAWPNQVGPGIETIRVAHRYAIAWPSIHPDTGLTYRWINPDGHTTIGQVPSPDDLPLLPQAWVDGLTAGRTTAAGGTRGDISDTAAKTWANQLPTGTPCRAVTKALERRLTDLAAGGGSRHDTVVEATQRLAHLGAERHTGVPTALLQLRAAFLDACARDRSRTPGEAEAEWDRQLIGAIALAGAPADHADPCDDPFAGLVDRAPASPAQALATASAAGATDSSSVVHETVDPSAVAVTTDTQEDTGTPPRPTWEPVDLTTYLDGTYEPERPTLAPRTDGVHMLYPRLVHDFHGESESGKSLVAQAITANLLRDGHDVLYVDWESGPHQLVGRLLALGATTDRIRDHFTYVRPEVSPYALLEAPAWAQLLTRTFTLAVLDGVTDALGQFGGGTKENDDIAAWHRAVPRMLTTRTSAAVVLIDHVVKNGEGRGRYALGGQAKMAAIDGASYIVEIDQPIGKGMCGTVILRIGKDRPGEIRPQCGRWRSLDRTQEACRVIIDSTSGDGIDVTFDPPTTHVTDPAGDDGKPFRPTGVMEKLSRLLEASREPVSQRRLQELYSADGGTGRKQTVLDAVNLLVDGGYVAEETGPRNARMLRSAKVYRQRTDPDSDAYVAPPSELVESSDTTGSAPVPTGSGNQMTTGSRTVPPEGGREPVQSPGVTRPVPRPEGHPDALLDRATGNWFNPHTGEVIDQW